jgi:DNA-binding CsgD family transcriptional regulator
VPARVLLATVFYMTVFSANAQFKERHDMDSLMRIVNDPKIEEVEKMEPLCRISRLYCIKEDSVQAEKYLSAATEIARRHKGTKYNVQIFFTDFIYQYKIAKNYSAAFDAIASLQKTVENISDKEYKALGYNYLWSTKSTVNYEKDKIDDVLYTTLTLAENLNESSRLKYSILYDCYNKIGFNFNDDLETAIVYYEKAYFAAQKANSVEMQCESLFNMGSCYLMLYYKQPSTAILDSILVKNFTAEKMMEKNRELVTKETYARIQTVLMESLLYKGEKEKAQNIAKNLENLYNQNPDLIRPLSWLQIYLTFENYDLAEKLALEILPTEFHLFDLFILYNTLSDIYEKRDDLPKANEALKNSFDNFRKYTQEQNIQSAQIAEAKYNYKKKELQMQQAKRITVYISVFSFLLLVTSFLMFLFFIKSTKSRELNLILEKENKQNELKIKEFEAERLQKEALSANLKIRQKEQTIRQIRENIASGKDYDKLNNLLKQDAFADKSFEDYHMHFMETVPNFYRQLQAMAFPNKLTTENLRLCAYMLMKFSNKEIANSLHIGHGAVRNAKSRLKSKLKLDKDTDLEQFIQNLTL